jgi:hypothetical protein
VTFPRSVTGIGAGAFDYCNSIEKIYFTGDAPRMGEGVFDHCEATAWYHTGTAGWETLTPEALAGANGKITLLKEDHSYVNGFCVGCNRPDPALEEISATLRGNLTAFGEGAVQLKLTTVEETALAAALTTADSTYTLTAVPGDYVLAVSMDGCVTRIYPVFLSGEETQLDVKLCLRGDVNGDGWMNMGDVSKIYSHIKGTTRLTDEYQLKCADYTNDGSITVGDTAKVYLKIKAN